MSVWQKCPICNGTGLVSGGFFSHAGDCETWVSDHTTEMCQRCQGIGTILAPDLYRDTKKCEEK